MRPARRRAAGFAIFLIMTLAPFGIYGTIAPAFTESCPSGRRSTIGNRVGAKSVSRVQIPDSPPELSAARLPHGYVPFSLLRRSGRVVECGGLENRLSGNPGYEGSNPSSSAIIV